MARIRSIKPEAFTSETLAKVSVNAERTFFGMSTIADDRGRLSDKPAQINGELWSMRGGHTAGDLDAELEELVKADGLVCRYTGCNGKRYLHLVTWDWHQKIDHPSKVRLPRCPHHPVSVTGQAEACGVHEGNCPVIRDTLASPREPSRGANGGDASLASTQRELEGTPETSQDSTETGGSSDQQEPESSRHSREPSRALATGSRTVDLGPRIVPPTAGAGKPRRENGADPEVTTGTLVADWIRSCRKRPPDRVIGQVSGELKKLLAEDHDVEDIRAGLTAWALAAKHPSTLASFVNETMNGSPASGRASPGREATGTTRARSAVEAGQRVQAMIDQGRHQP